jgi:hypothetical protein
MTKTQITSKTMIHGSNCKVAWEAFADARRAMQLRWVESRQRSAAVRDKAYAATNLAVDAAWNWLEADRYRADALADLEYDAAFRAAWADCAAVIFGADCGQAPNPGGPPPQSAEHSMTSTIPFPDVMTRKTGLTSWPDRGSASAPLMEYAWTGIGVTDCDEDGRDVTLTYEAQDGLWLVQGGGFPDLFARADLAWQFALDVVDGIRYAAEYTAADGTTRADMLRQRGEPGTR